MTRFLLIRHGVTESNKERRYMGRSEEPLSSDGRWQSRQLARRLASARIDAFYTSPLRRAKETAEIVNQPHALRVRVEPGFNELALDRWAGLSAAEIEARDPQAWKTWCADPSALLLEGIEPFGDLRRRIREALQRIRRNHQNQTVAATTHDGVIRIAVLEALDISLQLYRSITVDNTALTVIDIGEGRVYLRALNATGHLDEHTDPLLQAQPKGPAD